MVGTLIQGNFIGVALDGVTPLPNTTGIDINRAANIVIGGPAKSPELRNIISGNSEDGIDLQYALRIDITGNHISANSDGKLATPNKASGIHADDCNVLKIEHNLIHGNGEDGARLSGNYFSILGNIISANGDSGIILTGVAVGNTIEGNVVTGNLGDGILAELTDRGGVALDLTIADNMIAQNAGDGVALVADYVLAGPDPDAGAIVAGNVITDNGGNGVTISAGGSHTLTDNTIRSNDGYGVYHTAAAHYNHVSGGTIQDNGLAGRATYAASETGNTSLDTTYYNNGGLGIDRGSDGVTLDGVPDLVATPMSPWGSWLITGWIYREPRQTYVIQFFDNDEVDPTYFGEGQSLLGTRTVTTDANGVGKFVYGTISYFGFGLPHIRATSTGTDPDSWTSEFSKIRPPQHVTGKVGRDENQNGVFEPGSGEIVLPGVGVDLLDGGGQVLDHTTTGADGRYDFSDVPRGDYRVRFERPADLRPSPRKVPWAGPFADSDIDMTLRTDVVTIDEAHPTSDPDTDALFRPLTAVDDYYFTPYLTPVSGNVLDNDPPAAGDTLTVTLGATPGHGAVALAADGSFTYTPAAGFYGTDTFTYVVEDGFGLTATAVVTVNVAAPPRTTISGFIWRDLNGNGVNDYEPGVYNVTVQLLDENGNVVASVLTGPGSIYFVFDVLPGTYRIRVLLPEGYTFTTPGVDSDVDEYGNSDFFTTTGGENIFIDAGMIPPT